MSQSPLYGLLRTQRHRYCLITWFPATTVYNLSTLTYSHRNHNTVAFMMPRRCGQRAAAGGNPSEEMFHKTYRRTHRDILFPRHHDRRPEEVSPGTRISFLHAVVPELVNGRRSLAFVAAGSWYLSQQRTDGAGVGERGGPLQDHLHGDGRRHPQCIQEVLRFVGFD